MGRNIDPSIETRMIVFFGSRKDKRAYSVDELCHRFQTQDGVIAKVVRRIKRRGWIVSMDRDLCPFDGRPTTFYRVEPPQYSSPGK